jgi:hypothetical protein
MLKERTASQRKKKEKKKRIRKLSKIPGNVIHCLFVQGFSCILSTQVDTT